MNKTITDIFAQEDLDRSVLIGYYGGGNFGDELLLEVLMNLFAKRGVGSLTVTYQHPERYATYHHEFGYPRIDMADKLSVFKAIVKNRNIVIGGGGLWGLDVNTNIFVLSSLLFFSRFVLRKRVYLLGVGYYNSTTRLGHVSAWLAGKSANYIVSRDQESLSNFSRVNRHVALDMDIAYQLPQLGLAPYQQDCKTLNHAAPAAGKTLFISLRRFKPHQAASYTKQIETCLANNQDLTIIVALMEPRDVDPTGYKLISKWQRQYNNVRTLEFTYNPFALFLYFKKHSKHMALIGPQFHCIITALLTGVPFLPITYDNKVLELLKNATRAQPIPIDDLSQNMVQLFINDFKRSAQ
ncbi:polysaccharide pyruvyl transferase family protein [Candidatus Saccharibacteria bacterium]|nr:polysaccharide pyruvyl transferase family protein [Candidatus Saccharibacteria bacterium]